MPASVRICLVGLGAVNCTLLEIIIDKERVLEERYGVKFKVVGACDSSGARSCDDGFDKSRLVAIKKSKGHLSGCDQGVVVEGGAVTLSGSCEYDVLIDGSPCGVEPGMSCVKNALQRGRHAVLANKAPLVHGAFSELHTLAQTNNAQIGFSATVCGGLPVINVGTRDLVAATFASCEGVFNSTTNFILDKMACGTSHQDALAEAQRLGIAEADPSLDVNGWDTANKLVIIANAVLGAHGATLADVKVTGIRDITQELSAAANAAGEVYKLVAVAIRSDDGWKLSVEPQRVPKGSFIAGISGWEMGVIFKSDLFDTIYLKIDEPSVIPTASAVLRDVLTVSSTSRSTK